MTYLVLWTIRARTQFTFLINELDPRTLTIHSFLSDYWSKFSAAYPWVRRLAIYLDNATSTNKNRYLFSWAMDRLMSIMLTFLGIILLSNSLHMYPLCLVLCSYSNIMFRICSAKINNNYRHNKKINHDHKKEESFSIIIT